ncbi:phage portal protein [Timonella senegalensis]|uniref:phage portal protein n=1 Tax=Timonella senegalensis TaxID=1465825 RepID=UPI0028B00D9D|nr:phage portal protein [Timonella senegalensis]
MPETPDEWLDILARRLDARQPRILNLRSYANGKTPLPEGRRNLRESWKAFQKKARTNFGGLSVATVQSRIIPLGVAVGSDDTAPAAVAARRIWRDNRMRRQIKAATRDRLTCSIGYLVAGLDEDGRAVITREKPEDFIADVDPAIPWKARAALKVWRDETTGVDHAIVWIPGMRQRYVRDSRKRGYQTTVAVGDWLAAGEPELYEGNPPVVVLERMDGEGLFETHIDLIDRINQGKLDRLVISAYQAFRQRAIKPTKDGDGLPQEDADGNDIDWAKILEPAPGAMWDLPVPIDIWESAPTDIRPLLEAEKADARDFAAVMRLPISVFTPEGANQSATGADVTKEGLVSTAEEEIADITSGVEVAIVYALRAEGFDIGEDTVEVQWEPAAWVSVTEKFAAANQAQGILSSRTIKRDILGMSREQIKQDEADMGSDMLAAALMGVTSGSNNGTTQSADPGRAGGTPTDS